MARLIDMLEIGELMEPSTPGTSFQRTHTRAGFGPLNSDR